MRKKLLMTLLALFGVLGGVFAQPFTASSSKDAGDAHWYTIQLKNANGNRMCYDKGDDQLGQVLSSSVTFTPTNISTYAFCFVTDGENYKIYNQASGKAVYVDAVTDHAPVKLSSENASQIGWRLTNDNNYLYDVANGNEQNTLASWSQNDAYVAISAGSARQNFSGSCAIITEIEDYTVTVTGVSDQGGLVVGGVNVTNGETFRYPHLSNANAFNAQQVDGMIASVSLTDHTITVAYESSVIDFDKVYRIQLRQGGDPANYNFYYDATDNHVKTRNATDAGALCAERLFYFKNVNGNVTLHNIRAEVINGAGSGVTVTSGNNAIASISATPTEFSVVSNSNGGFSLRHPGSATAHVNDVNGQLGVWNHGSSQNDLGSMFTITPVEGSEFTSLTTISGDDSSPFLGLGSFATDAAKRSTAVSAPTPANVLALCTPVFSQVVNTSKVYRLKCQDTDRSDNYLYSDIHANVNGEVDDAGADHRLIKSQSATGVANTLFKFEANGSAYYIQHVNSGKYLSGATGGVDLPFAKANASTYEPALIKGQWWGIKKTGTSIHLHQSNHADRKLLVWGALNAEAASNWTIEEVTEIPVTVGSAGYSTFCAPVNVVVPNSVEAYIISNSTDENVTLTQVEGTILPANTGVILKNQGEHIFTITNDAADIDVADNQLTGTTIRRQGFTENSIYVLALDNGSVALCPNGTVAGVPANKAYLANGSAGVAALGFSFEAVETAIQNLEAEKMANSTIYDLSGRKVSKADKGMFIINGKKVLK